MRRLMACRCFPCQVESGFGEVRSRCLCAILFGATASSLAVLLLINNDLLSALKRVRSSWFVSAWASAFGLYSIMESKWFFQLATSNRCLRILITTTTTDPLEKCHSRVEYQLVLSTYCSRRRHSNEPCLKLSPVEIFHDLATPRKLKIRNCTVHSISVICSRLRSCRSWRPMKRRHGRPFRPRYT